MNTRLHFCKEGEDGELGKGLSLVAEGSKVNFFKVGRHALNGAWLDR
jgi:hypothetical protein